MEHQAHVQLLAPLTIGAAIPATSTTPVLISNAKYIAAQAKFLYGAGGTTVNAYIQTSLDGGVTWLDIMNFSFTTSAATKVSSTTGAIALAPATSPGDGALTANTILTGLLGDRFKVKYVTTGTYTGATSLAVDIVVSF